VDGRVSYTLELTIKFQVNYARRSF
jgi:hypothetical protein